MNPHNYWSLWEARIEHMGETMVRLELLDLDDFDNICALLHPMIGV